MMNQAEARAFAETLVLHEVPEAENPFSAEQPGQVVIVPVPDDPDGQVEVTIYTRPGLTVEEKASFAHWARERVVAFLMIGPESDGWFPRSLGGWKITARNADMPPDPFL